MNKETRIELMDTVSDMVFKMSEGNPGAVTVLAQLLTKGDAIDTAAAMGGGLASILDLDSLGIYGSKIWVLYKNQCGQDLEKFMAVLRGWQLGHLSDEQVVTASESNYPILDLDATLAFVKERLGEEWVSPAQTA